MSFATQTGDRCSVSFTALGTTAVVATTDPADLRGAQQVVERELAAIDLACSRFRADSELARVHASNGAWVAIGDLLAEALAAALAAAADTAGIVDPTVGNSLLALGYVHDFRSDPPSSPRPPSMAPAGSWREIELDRDAGRVRVPPGIRLDLGATAKALAADRAAIAAADAAAGALVSLGGDIRVAGAAPAAGWVVHVTDDHRAALGPDGQTIAITTGGLATSSTTVRAWQRGGVTVHHIVDPATGAPPEPVWRTVSVAARTCLEANVAATAAIVLGHGAVAWLGRRALPARLVSPSGAVAAVAGWPVLRSSELDP